MATSNKSDIVQELLQMLKKFSRVRWEQHSNQELKPSESELLSMLYLTLLDDTKTLSASKLSNALNITPAGVTHMLNPLEEAGYIKRHKDPNDRRVALIVLTDKGNQFAETFNRKAYEGLVGLVDHLGEEDSKILIRVMSSTIEYFATHSIK